MEPTWSTDRPTTNINSVTDALNTYVQPPKPDVTTIKGLIEALEVKEIESQQYSGIYEDEDEFFNELYDLVHCGKTILFEDVLERNIDNQKFQDLEYFYEILVKNPNLSFNRITAFMKGANLMVSDSYTDKYAEWIAGFIGSRPTPFKVDATFRRVITDCIKWSFTYLNGYENVPSINRKVHVWYKQKALTESHKWFMKLAIALDFKIVYIDITKENSVDFLQLVDLPEYSEPRPLPTEKVEVFTTVAHDASFSFDGAIGAFAITPDPIIIMLGLGLNGAMFVRSLTVFLVENGTLNELVYLDHGAHWAIIILSILLLLSINIEIPEVVTGLIGAIIIGASFISSIVYNKKHKNS